VKEEIKMAKRYVFLATPTSERLIAEMPWEFTYHNGFALSQKQKSIHSLHESILKMHKNLQILEISTKSMTPIGVQLSAFNLKLYDEIKQTEYPVENIYQSSKVFESGGPFRDLLDVHPKEAKRDQRLVTSGKLIQFEYKNTVWKTEPKTIFYDWLYIKALYENPQLTQKLVNYNAFTDIEFNDKKSINCQARAAAIFVSLNTLGLIEEYLADKVKFKTIYCCRKHVQTSLFNT